MLAGGRRWCGPTGVERVGLVDTNSPAVPLLLYAGALAGVPFIAVNYRLADERLRSVVERVAPALVVTDEATRARIQDVPGLELLAAWRVGGALEEAERAADPEVDTDAVAIWLFTSGTTGEPKAALLRHRHLVSYVLSTVEFMCAGEDEATLVSVPPYHVAGMAAVLSSTYAGRRIVYLPQFDPDDWVRLARRRR